MKNIISQDSKISCCDNIKKNKTQKDKKCKECCYKKINQTTINIVKTKKIKYINHNNFKFINICFNKKDFFGKNIRKFNLPPGWDNNFYNKNIIGKNKKIE